MLFDIYFIIVITIVIIISSSIIISIIFKVSFAILWSALLCLEVQGERGEEEEKKCR